MGEAGWNVDTPDAELRRRISFDLNDGPALPEDNRWKQALDSAVRRTPYPDDDRLREQVQHAISGGHLLKGPLAIIVETHWKEQL